jgi:hypothetical protein
MLHSSVRPGRSRVRTRVAITTLALATATTLAMTPAGASDPDPIGDPLPDIETGPAQVGLQTVSSDFVAPLAGVTAAGQPDMMYVVDQVGQLKELNVRTTQPGDMLRTVIDVSNVLAGPLDPRTSEGSPGRRSRTTDDCSPTRPRPSTRPRRRPSRCRRTRRAPVTSLMWCRTTAA